MLLLLIGHAFTGNGWLPEAGAADGGDVKVRALVDRKGVSVVSACACFTGYCPDCTEELRHEGRL